MNHWPVAQIASSDRPCVASDRASHSSLSHLYWKLYSQQPNNETKILMDGLTRLAAPELLPLARSWIAPPEIHLTGEGYRNDGYDPTQRAWVITKIGPGAAKPVQLTFAASDASPLFDPAVVIVNWGDDDPQVRVDGDPVKWGINYREGHVQHLDSADLVIWLRTESTRSLRIEMSPAR